MAVRRLKCLVLEPGKPGRFVEVDNDLKGLQAIVGGYIEYAPVGVRSCGVICNENGYAEGLPFNIVIGHHQLVGTIMIVKQHNSGGWRSLPEQDQLFWKSFLFNRGRWEDGK
jgi:hypothetical protein